MPRPTDLVLVPSPCSSSPQSTRPDRSLEASTAVPAAVLVVRLLGPVPPTVVRVRLDLPPRVWPLVPLPDRRHLWLLGALECQQQDAGESVQSTECGGSRGAERRAVGGVDGQGQAVEGCESVSLVVTGTSMAAERRHSMGGMLLNAGSGPKRVAASREWSASDRPAGEGRAELIMPASQPRSNLAGLPHGETCAD